MPKCQNCRNGEGTTTWWEQTRYWLMFRLFPQDVDNLSGEKYTRGFGVGYRQGFQACLNQEKSREEALQEIIKEGAKDWLQPFEEAKSQSNENQQT